MRAKLFAVAVLGAGYLLSGCAALTHYNVGRTYAPQQNTVRATFIDAKQRTVLAAGTKTGLKFCAEPSPDALSALAASQGLSLTTPNKINLSEAASISEAAGSIGLRTQSIQLMRDAMYRICEGYISGALDESAFETLHRRLQSSMVAILAIEQLTGAVKAQQIILGGSAGTGSAQAVQDLTAKSQTSLAALRQAETDKAATDTELASRIKTRDMAKATAAGAAADKKVEAETALKTAEDAVTAQTKVVADREKARSDADSAYKVVEAARMAAIGGSTNAQSTGQFGSVAGGVLSADTTGKVADAISSIVDNTLRLGFSRELCASVLGSAPGRYNPEVTAKCLALLQTSVDAANVENKGVETATKALTEGRIKADDFLGLLKWLTTYQNSRALSYTMVSDSPLKNSVGVDTAPARLLAPPATPNRTKSKSRPK